MDLCRPSCFTRISSAWTSWLITVKVPVEMVERAKGVLVGGRMRLVRRVVDVRFVCPRRSRRRSRWMSRRSMVMKPSVTASAQPPTASEKVFEDDFVVVQCVKGRAARQAEAEEEAS